jgi:hypothetical protein
MSPEPDEIEWTPLVSSHVAAMKYIATESKLLVQYSNGQVYEFSANQEEADGLRNAVSPGRYLNLMWRKTGTRVS